MAECINGEIFDMELNEEDNQIDSDNDEVGQNENYFVAYRPESSGFKQKTVDLSAKNVNLQKIKLGPKDFELRTMLGKGTFGKVYLVRKIAGHNSDKYFAMKVLKKASIVLNDKDTAHTISERKVLEAVKHPFIVDLVYAFQTEGKLYLIMEYLRGGELFTHLIREGMFFEYSTRFFACEIILALGHLHQLGVIYRDLKPENILLDAEGHIKLSDFGLCKEQMLDGDLTYTSCGTVQYMAPEVVARTGHGKDADWWSLGVLIYEMITGESPFNDSSRERIIWSIMGSKIRFPDYVKPKAKDLVRSLLKRKVEKRLGSGPDDAVAIQSHPFFKKVKWSDVLAKRLEPPFRPLSRNDSDCSQFDIKYTKQAAVESPGEPLSGDYHFEGFSYERERQSRSPFRTPRQLRGEGSSGSIDLHALNGTCARAIPLHQHKFAARHQSPPYTRNRNLNN